MANPEHVDVVRGGRQAILKWQQSNPSMRLDLREADLRGVDLSEAYLIDAMLASANLSKANLRKARLPYADLFQADLTGADLSEASLAFAYLNAANLSGAKVTGADLGVADLSFTDLTRADLRGAQLYAAKFLSSTLVSTDLSEAVFEMTSISAVDLNEPTGLAAADHRSYSNVDVGTLIITTHKAGGQLTPDVRSFLLNAGVPHEMLDVLPGIVSDVEYYSCFVCYGQPDLEFAKRLAEELKRRGVSCWLYDMDSTIGERTWAEIGEKRREAEKMVVLCSAAALLRDGVLKEIEEQIDEGPDKLVPISLDDTWKEPGFRVMRGDRDLKPFLLERNYADFANLEYGEALERLLAGLRRPTRRSRKKG